MENYGLPENVAKKLNQKQRTVLEKYSTKTKRTAVIRWRTRMAKAGIKVGDVAEKTGRPIERISEWLNFKYEPQEEAFLDVDKAIYDLGG